MGGIYGDRHLTLLYFVIVIAYVMSFYVVASEMYNRYENDITKITPYMERKQVEFIQSDWKCMQCKEDFDNVYKKINAIKDENGLP